MTTTDTATKVGNIGARLSILHPGKFGSQEQRVFPVSITPEGTMKIM